MLHSVSHKFNSIGGKHFPAKQIFSCRFFFIYPFYPALYIFPSHIQVLVPDLSMNLSLNQSKNDLTFHPGQYQHTFCELIHGVYVYPQAHVCSNIHFCNIYMHTKHWCKNCTLLQCIGFLCM